MMSPPNPQQFTVTFQPGPLGMGLETQDGSITVADVAPGGTALKAGVSLGSTIVAVNGEEVKGYSQESVTRLLRKMGERVIKFAWEPERVFDRYISDSKMAKTLNPLAMRNLVQRLLDAHGGTHWPGATGAQRQRLTELQSELGGGASASGMAEKAIAASSTGAQAQASVPALATAATQSAAAVERAAAAKVAAQAARDKLEAARAAASAAKAKADAAKAAAASSAANSAATHSVPYA